MKTKFFLTCLAAAVIIKCHMDMRDYNLNKTTCENHTNIEEANSETGMSEWQIFTLAIIDVESNSNPLAIGKKDDVGILQITPIYVEEVNRLQTRTTYYLSDRYDIEKSLEMFGIMNFFKNPDMDIDTAIKLHNPNASPAYRMKIMERMDEIRAGGAVDEKVRSIVCKYN